jgi:hypothetical protein
MTYRFKGLLTGSDQGPSDLCAIEEEVKELEVLLLRPMNAEQDCCCVVDHPLNRSLPLIRVDAIAMSWIELC